MPAHSTNRARRSIDIVQIAYFVSDIEAAAERLHAMLGVGPFFVAHHIELINVRYRGEPAELDHSSAYVQAGPVMLELVQQNGEYASPFRDMYAPGESGIHHTAAFVADLDATLERYARDGYETALYAETGTGVRFAFVDARPLLGHMLEFYEESAVIRGFYALVAERAASWDGKELFVALNDTS
ncbi:MAG: VOC family protein [Chloroflexi bacterium]|nr:MAG: VOC family protein [Chloroflexota bacterium]